MRPRKTILLVQADEAQLGVQRFILETRGYCVVEAQDEASAMSLQELDVDLVLGYPVLNELDWPQLAERMKQAHPEIPILLVGGSEVAAANVAMCAERTCTSDLLERIRCLISRKRGLRKMVLMYGIRRARISLASAERSELPSLHSEHGQGPRGAHPAARHQAELRALHQCGEGEPRGTDAAQAAASELRGAGGLHHGAAGS